MSIENIERFRLLAAVIAAHPDGKVLGRTRLQKTIRLLQRLGLPTNYSYMLHFYGPYSEGVQAEVGLLEQLGLVEESLQSTLYEDHPWYIISARHGAEQEEVNSEYGENIKIMAEAEPVILELAATYDAFRDMGMDDNQALKATKRKKPSKCQGDNLDNAIKLLKDLGLPTS